MRLRVRGPSGQSTVTLDDSATVETLSKTIEIETSLTSFDIKYGYPPKTLSLGDYKSTTKLSELGFDLNGEQLTISKSEIKESGPPLLAGNRSEEIPPALVQQPQPIQKTQISETPPLSLSRKANAEIAEDPPEILLPDLGGTLLLRIMPDDNSCLFRAIASAVMPGIDTMTELRSFVAQTIQADPEKYTKVVLDNKEPDDYCRWIQTEDAWGGQIELEILSRQFDIEVCSIDVQRLRVDHYNEGMPNRCIVVYSGIHYDTIALSPFDMTPEYDVKIFESPEKDEILKQAVMLCQKLQDQHYYTDTAGFRIMCNDCGTICVGESGATEHASKTGHYNFGEA